MFYGLRILAIEDFNFVACSQHGRDDPSIDFCQHGLELPTFVESINQIAHLLICGNLLSFKQSCLLFNQINDCSVVLNHPVIRHHFLEFSCCDISNN